MSSFSVRSALLVGALLLSVTLVGFQFLSTPTPPEDEGEAIYQTRCMSCHQVNGEGIAGVFPPLVDTEWVVGDKGRLIRIVLNGMTGEMKVNDVTSSGAMPPWNAFLNDEQVAAVLTYVRNAWDNGASAVTVAEVSSVRKATENRKNPWTMEELMAEENTGVPGVPKFNFPGLGGAAPDTTSGQ